MRWVSLGILIAALASSPAPLLVETFDLDTRPKPGLVTRSTGLLIAPLMQRDMAVLAVSCLVCA